MRWILGIAAAIVLFTAGPAHAVVPYFDVGDKPDVYIFKVSFTSSSDSTYNLGFPADYASVQKGTEKFKVQWLGDPTEVIPVKPFYSSKAENPRAGRPRVDCPVPIPVAANTPEDFFGGGVVQIRILGDGGPGEVWIYAVKSRGPR